VAFAKADGGNIHNLQQQDQQQQLSIDYGVAGNMGLMILLLYPVPSHLSFDLFCWG
jgi:hypothetical protein